MRVDLDGDERSAAIMCINCKFKGGNECSCVDVCTHRSDVRIDLTKLMIVGVTALSRNRLPSRLEI